MNLYIYVNVSVSISMAFFGIGLKYFAHSQRMLMSAYQSFSDTTICCTSYGCVGFYPKTIYKRYSFDRPLFHRIHSICVDGRSLLFPADKKKIQFLLIAMNENDRDRATYEGRMRRGEKVTVKEMGRVSLANKC